MELEKNRQESIMLCENLLTKMQKSKDDAANFFQGEVYTAYIDATEKAINKAKKILNDIKNL